MESEWPILEVLGTEEEARLVCGFLENNGIDCRIESLRFHQEPVNFGRLGEVRVHVEKDRLDAARTMLAELRAGEPLLAEGSEEESGG